MSSLSYEVDWKKYLMCKQCWQYKELTPDNWYYHPEGYLWVLGRCQDCIKRWRKSEHERLMARKRDEYRYYNNPKRNEYVKEKSAERIIRKWYKLVHWRTARKIKKLWIRPELCPICGSRTRIISHHPDYEHWNQIVFCCQPCHAKIHNWILTEYDIIDLLRF